MTILIAACSAVLLMIVQRRRAELLALHTPPSSVGLGIIGCCTEMIGLRTGGPVGSALIMIGMICLCCAAWGLRHWPGGWLLIAGVACNGVVMAVHGRMPITPDVLQRVGLTVPTGTVLAGSKDIVASGWLAAWGGDRFITVVPFTDFTSVWSIGDLLLLAGALRAVTLRLDQTSLTLTSSHAAPEAPGA